MFAMSKLEALAAGPPANSRVSALMDSAAQLCGKVGVTAPAFAPPEGLFALLLSKHTAQPQPRQPQLPDTAAALQLLLDQARHAQPAAPAPAPAPPRLPAAAAALASNRGQQLLETLGALSTACGGDDLLGQVVMHLERQPQQQPPLQQQQLPPPLPAAPAALVAPVAPPQQQQPQLDDVVLLEAARVLLLQLQHEGGLLHAATPQRQERQEAARFESLGRQQQVQRQQPPQQSSAFNLSRMSSHEGGACSSGADTQLDQMETHMADTQGDPKHAHLSAARSSKSGPPAGAGGGVSKAVAVRDKNRAAQRRFRERQRENLINMRAEAEELRRVVAEQQNEIAALRQLNEQLVAAAGGGADAAGAGVAAAGELAGAEAAGGGERADCAPLGAWGLPALCALRAGD